jgi:hypothetical protein
VCVYVQSIYLSIYLYIWYLYCFLLLGYITHPAPTLYDPACMGCLVIKIYPY